MKRILFPNHQKYSLVLSGVSSNNYSSYPGKNKINFSSRINQFTGNEKLVNYRPSFDEIEGLMEYRQSPTKEAGIKEVKNLETIIRVVQQNKKHYSPKNIKVWIAASSIILIVVLTAIIRHIKSNEASQVYDTFFTVPSSTLVNRLTSIPFPTDWNNAVASYTAGDYSVAIDGFTLIPSGSVYSDFATFYKGICFMAVNQFSKAMETFELISSSSSVFIQTKYYSGLCNIKLNRINAARVIFSELTISEECAKNATEILLKLESID